MKLSEILKLSALSLVALFVFNFGASAQITPADPIPVLKGPCEQAVGTSGVPAACEDGCVVYCTDPCVVITWQHANCDNIEGPCKRQIRDLGKEFCRDCTCTWPFGGCVDLGFYYSGSTPVLVCV